YNTYTHPGLPPGPIGSPGLPAIEAVLAAEPGDYLYYVAQADGHHVFTRSYEEHQQETENIYGSSS
ncbi:MAG: endolytic transglycosylase MltG, partial [Dialister sp.]|nr:endolytic transglycosylase MltG [Dialister sp.]